MTESRATSAPMAAAHLSEAERHGLADDTLVEERRAAALAHAAVCTACADDVARLSAFRARVAQPPTMPSSTNARDATLDALWPEIRTRIERGKLVPLGARGIVPNRRSGARGRRAWLGAALVAATLLVLALPLARVAQRGSAAVAARPIALPAVPPARSSLVVVADSASVYRQQVQALLEDLEMRRAMLRPSTAATFDRDLRLIDDAIAELTAALARDPNNPALRQLLAASYRQKRDLLERLQNAS